MHLLVGHTPVMRREGALMLMENMGELTRETIDQVIQEICTTQQQEQFQRERDLDLSYHIREGRFRLNIHWQRGEPGMVARVIADTIPTMDAVRLPEVVRQMVQSHQGLILLTGATGNGKSTNLAAMVDCINDERAAHIITLEDPIEFIHASRRSIVRQRELGADFVSFTEALKHVVRQDPDVVMVGEMRDLETIAATITLAETGHLVLATLHTFSAPQSVDRIIDSFPAFQQSQIRLQLSITLLGIVSQRLVLRASGGRVAAREVLVNTPAVANCIRENKIHMIRSILQTGSSDGMFTMDQHLRELHQQGVITRETALAYMSFPEEL